MICAIKSIITSSLEGVSVKIYLYDDKKNIIGDKVKMLRKDKKLSQKSLAEQLQLMGYEFSDLTILRIETGKRLCTDFELKALANYFDVSADFLLDNE